MTLNENEQDSLLWRQFKDGDEESFVRLFRNYYSDLFNYGCKITKDHALVEDCIQDLFADIWRNNGKTEINSLKAYFFRAFKFKLLKALSKTHRRNNIPGRLIEEFEISYENILIRDQDNEAMRQKVYNAISQLSARQREIIYLKFHQNLSYDEISEIMHINYQAARNLTYQSIKMLKKIITVLVPFAGISFL
ncbi:MAG TPA: sigma-70 family RNA polymerase sigma factor [Chitinophagaceae bacterium]|nr:sigma-70 family RNA polymerase sigma factor [Chitinophagaceae bacterium]